MGHLRCLNSLATMKILQAALWGTLLFPTMVLSQTLCKKGEVAYFSCQTSINEKVISVCGNNISNEISDDSWLQYRFGQIGKIELTYPMEKKNSIAKFEGHFFVRYSLVSLRFINNKILYDVSLSGGSEDEDTHEKIPPSGGVSILLSKTKNLNITCNNIDVNKYYGLFSELALLIGDADFLSVFYSKASK